MDPDDLATKEPLEDTTKGAKKAKKKRKVPMCCHGCLSQALKFTATSRFGGIPLAILYGLFVFYYITVVFSDFTLKSAPESKDVQTVDSNATFNIDILADLECETSSQIQLPNPELDLTDQEESAYSSRKFAIGAGVGGGVGVALGVSSVFSRHTRCAMALILPSIFAGRGRALMLTAAMGILLDGPVANINRNMEEVMRSLTCMYDQMRIMACRFQVEIRSVFGQFGQVLNQAQRIIVEQMEALEAQAKELEGQLRREAEEARDNMEQQTKELKDKLDDLKEVLDAPGNILNSGCQGVSSALSVSGGFFQDAGNEIKNVVTDAGNIFRNPFGRKKRSSDDGCGIQGVVPDVDINAPALDLDSLKTWINKLAPDVDLVDLNLDGFQNMLQAQSLSGIRYELIKLMEGVFILMQEISSHLKTILYLISLVLIVVDAFLYLRNYTSDGQFDNKYVDDNLRWLWREDSEKEKLTPIRRWERREKYQVSKSFKISRAEAKRILLHAIPTLLFTVATVLVLVADYALVTLLEAILENGEFAISFQGMEQGIQLGQLFGELESGQMNLASLKLEAFDLTTDPCLPKASRTSSKDLAILGSILAAAALSCIFDAYASRWRAQICNAFYPVRAQQRAEHLYERILNGRAVRHLQLKHVIFGEIERRRRLDEFSWWSRLVARLGRRRGAKSKFRCPACHYKIKRKDADVEVVTLNDMDGVQIEAEICSDCYKDYQK